MAKQNLKEKLINRKIKTPNRFIASVVVFAFRRIAKKRHVTFTYEGDVKSYMKKQVIVISQHCSRDEYIYTLAGFHKRDLHCVIGYQNFFDKATYNLLLKLGTIAKYLYQPDPTATKQMLRVVHNGESLLFFPEGIQSTSGSNHPINPATIKFLAKCRLPVVLCTSHGSYLTRPRYSAKRRMGQMNFNYKLLFTPEDFATLTQDELYSKLLEAFRYNEFDFNRQARIPFVGDCPNIEGLEGIIFKCPHCGEEFTFSTSGDVMTCSHCGYAVSMDSYYDLHAASDIPLYFDDIDKWYKWQRKQVAQEIAQPDFKLEAPVKAFDLDLYKLKNYPDLVGEGTLTITNHFFTYCGSYKGQQVQIPLDIKELPSVSFSPALHNVELYYQNDYYCFEPTTNTLQTVKWMLAVEEIHNLYDEHWRKASQDAYDNN